MLPVSDAEPVSTIACEGVRAATPRYLVLRGGVYYFKRKIPQAAVKARGLKSDQCWRSLNTDCLEVALKRLKGEVNLFEAEFASPPHAEAGRNVKIGPQAGSSAGRVLLATAHLPLLLHRYAYAHLVTDDDERRAMTGSERAVRLAQFEVGLNLKYEQSAAEDLREYEELANELLHLEGLTYSRGSPLWGRFVSELLAKDIEVLEAQCGRLRGHRTVTPMSIPRAPRALATIDDLFNAWTRVQPLVRTVDDYGRYVQAFKDEFGQVPVEGINEDNACHFRDVLQKKQLARTTIKNYLGGLSALVNFGISENLCKLQNPFESISLRSLLEKPSSEDRRPYEMEELQQLYGSPLFASRAVPHGQAQESAYWAPLMCPFFGGRIEEIAQLRVEDVQCIDSIWVIRVCDLDVNQHIKTDSSFRTVPIHTELVRLGFLRYVAEQKLAGQKRVFPSQKNENKHGIWSNALGKFYGRYLRAIGLEDPRLCFHSFRYTFKQRCAVLGVSDEVRDALSGHWLSRKNAGAVYLKRPRRQYPLQALKNAIDTLHYSDLDLSHLHDARPLAGVREAFGVQAEACAEVMLKE